MFAVIQTGGKQYTVSEGDVLKIEKLSAEKGETVEFDNVLLVSNDGTDAKIGAPVEGAKVTAVVIKEGKGKKIDIFKMKPKTGYRKRQGHRQPYTEVRITEVVG